ncbi:uncharacterized protein N7458_012817 [Penicillium daleae]|uniref:Amino acid transporter transmembrane domain-containing protein n=1 Tax=Penicillium daleae TaxID=63821 RepID=A0AAD6BX42_9EURO|nr:uncharacterized protein N7458_012817 [Penicillium daleae]KAJ5433661.1 hypothetical protein N7458_012817 [Penicillium daleae]
MSKSKAIDCPEIDRAPPQVGEIHDAEKYMHHDAVFGDMGEGGPNYRNVRIEHNIVTTTSDLFKLGWIGTAVLMTKTQIGLGVLGIPSVLNTVGLIPGIILLLVVGGITTWSDYIVGDFKIRHRHVYSIDDVGEMLFGPIGREFFGVALSLSFTFIAGSAMLSISIAFNALSNHAICTAIFVAIAAVITFVFASIRTLGKISALAWVGAASIIISVFTVTIAVGVQDRPAAAPQQGPWKSDYKLFSSPTYAEAQTAVSTLIFAYAGTPAFFPIVSEMRDPRQYTKALVACQTLVTVTYITIGLIVYYYCGTYVASPALGSAGAIIKKVAYGVALPGLFVTALLWTHLPAKYIFVRILRGSPHLTANTITHWITWIGSTFTITLVAYIIASSVPVFEDLVSLVGASFQTLLSTQTMGMMWLYDNWPVSKRVRDSRWYIGVAWSVFVIVAGTYLMVGGTYSSILAIIKSYHESGWTAAWSCADNSNSS